MGQPRNKLSNKWSNDFQQRCQDHSMKDSFCNQWFWGKKPYTCKRMKWDPYLTPYTEINSK